LLKQLYCNILEDNKESISLFLKKGFRITGEKSAWIKTTGGWKSEYFLQLVF
jgi:diamine N-acetyltransferase